MSSYGYRFGLFCLAVFCWLRDDYVHRVSWQVVGWVFFVLAVMLDTELSAERRKNNKEKS